MAPIPVSRAGELLTLTEAAGVAFDDVTTRQGLNPGKLPDVLGFDAVGRALVAPMTSTPYSCSTTSPPTRCSTTSHDRRGDAVLVLGAPVGRLRAHPDRTRGRGHGVRNVQPPRRDRVEALGATWVADAKLTPGPHRLLEGRKVTGKIELVPSTAE
ncbi:hypothetical protein [Cryptosporangium sp. NPDC048952]|uniref:hypothetical protein n=1 Tax=Cryptosporangium sp. NPDC048952 TaxID=3363961 RepID=UPI003721046B